CHLVNGNYNPDKDDVTPQGGFSVLLSRSLFAGSAVAKATLYAPNREPVVVPVSNTDNDVRVTVPELHLWGVLSLERQQAALR
ncbi:MAG: hypothetical protein QHJ73_08705, partial [Armatimonadota bacterium]|nr:hypothetical protein [Armatimonadota bacterium]